MLDKQKIMSYNKAIKRKERKRNKENKNRRYKPMG